MSLFGSLLRDMEQDPIFGAHQRAMNRMMNSFFPPGAGMPGMPRIQHGGMRQQEHHHHDEMMPFGGNMMSPFGGFGGFPDLSMMFNGGMVPHGPNGTAFSSSSFVSISSGPDGRPQVYQASSETRQGPNGVRETRKTLADSRSGTKKMAVGRHLGEKGHVVEREQNTRTGQLNENHEFYNIDEEEAPRFDREWKQRAHHGVNGRYAHSASMPALTSASHAAAVAAAGPSRSSYVEPPSDDEIEETVYPSPSDGYQPRHSQSAVTIEELPPSDDEVEEIQQQSRSTNARRSYPHAAAAAAPSAAAAGAPMPSSSRRSPYETSKEKRQKRARLGKKY